MTVAGARDTVGGQVVQQSGIQCFNCKEFGHFTKECRKPKRLADTDEEIDKQELEAHYSFMAKIQEVPNADSGTDSEPLEHVQYDTEDNVFANAIQHYEQSESISNACVVETGDSNVIPDLPDMCDNDIQNDQNAVECDDERVALANLITNLKLDNFRESNSIRDSCLVALQNKQTELEKYTAFNDRTVTYKKLKHKLNETLGLLAQKDNDIKEGLKVKAYKISVVQEKHGELVKQSLLTKSHYEGPVKEKTKFIMDLKLKKEKDIDKMISMEKQLTFLNEILYKRSQSIQTIHMLAPKCPTFNGRPIFANPLYLKKAQYEKQCLYEIPHDQFDPANRLVPDREEILTLEEESRSKLNKDLNDSFAFVHELKQEMHADLKYVEYLEDEIDELESDKAEFSNMYDMLLQECMSKDVICSYLQSLSDLDEITELQCLYLHKVRECDCLVQKLSKQTEFVSKEVYTKLLRSFAKLEKHSISLELALQQCKEQMKNNTVCKEKASNVFQKEREYFEIQYLKAQLQDKNIAIKGLSKPVTTQNLPQTATTAVRNTNVIKPSMYQIDSSATQTRAPQLPQTYRNTNPRVSTSTGVPHRTNVSRPQPRSNQKKDKGAGGAAHMRNPRPGVVGVGRHNNAHQTIQGSKDKLQMGFSDADHADCVDTRKSTFGGIQFLGDKLVSWMSKKQDCTAMSSIKAEYVALSASFSHSKFMQPRAALSTEYQLVNMFTKALLEDRFQYLVRRIGMRCLTPAELEVIRWWWYPSPAEVGFITTCSCSKTFYKHQDSRIKKAQDLMTKTFVYFDINDNSSEIKLRGRLLASFQDNAKYEHVGPDTRSQGGKDDRDGRIKI
ncbi:integrase, catalytic region, zinc finger, CCHC-type containing protein [Tanacetum coccineum]